MPEDLATPGFGLHAKALAKRGSVREPCCKPHILTFASKGDERGLALQIQVAISRSKFSPPGGRCTSERWDCKRSRWRELGTCICNVNLQSLASTRAPSIAPSIASGAPSTAQRRLLSADAATQIAEAAGVPLQQATIHCCTDVQVQMAHAARNAGAACKKDGRMVTQSGKRAAAARSVVVHACTRARTIVAPLAHGRACQR